MQLNFEYANLVIGVESRDREDLVWLREFLTPWFRVTDATAQVMVTVSADPARYEHLRRSGSPGAEVEAFLLDTRVLSYPVWETGAPGTLLHDAENRLFFAVNDEHIAIICDGSDLSYRIRLLRVIRELTTEAVHTGGSRFLHAAAIDTGSGAALITGPRRAGKTTLLIYLMQHLPVSFLANDRVQVDLQGSGAVLQGMPTVVSVREGSLDFFPQLHRALQQRHYVSRRTLAQCREAEAAGGPQQQSGCYRLSPRQFEALLGRRPVPGSPGRLVIFPRLCATASGMQWRKLDASQTAEALGDSFFQCVGPAHRSQAFRMPAPAQQAITPPDDNSLCESLAATLTGYECLLGPDAYDDKSGAEVFRQLIPEGAAA